MLFENPLISARLIRRYKRFLADVMLADGTETTVHCPNPGAMLGLKAPGSRVWISDSMNPKRKLQYTLELIHVGNTMVGVNTNRANRLAREAMDAGMIEGVNAASNILPEQKYGEKSRIDFLVRNDGEPDHYIEVKNVHLQRKPGLHEFPDSVTARGSRHLNELIREVERKNRATMLFIIQRDDGDEFKIAGDIDPKYALAFENAVDRGVNVLAIKCRVTKNGIYPAKRIAITL